MGVEKEQFEEDYLISYEHYILLKKEIHSVLEEWKKIKNDLTLPYNNEILSLSSEKEYFALSKRLKLLKTIFNELLVILKEERENLYNLRNIYNNSFLSENKELLNVIEYRALKS